MAVDISGDDFNLIAILLLKKLFFVIREEAEKNPNHVIGFARLAHVLEKGFSLADNDVIFITGKLRRAEVLEYVHDQGRRLWLDASTDTLLVLSKELEPLAEKYHIELRRLAELLKDYRAGSARRERIGGRLYQLWQFRRGLFQLRRSGEE